MPTLGSNNEEPCVVRLVEDSPSDTDSFRHREIAKAIAGMILGESGGKAIGLTGPWGSGKSTVVRFMEDELTKSNHDCKVIVFDTWTHQGDPLRRSFLEETIAKLENWITDHKKWERKSDLLAKRLVETKTKTSPELTGWGALGALCILVSPVAYEAFSVVHKKESSALLWYEWVLLLVGAAPLILALIITLVWAARRIWDRECKFPSLIFNASENTTETSSSRTPEPTSFEFTETYCELVHDTLRDGNRKLIFVIDNLDRLPGDDAKSLWSTLKTFHDSSLRRTPEFASVWIVVPFDDGAVETLWSDDDGDEKPTTHFIDKTFQAIFRVPPALLTNWEAFLQTQLCQAFPKHKVDKRLSDISVIYSLMRPELERPPTPRQIKTFVNGLGTVHRQWKHQTDIRSQAAFTLAVNSKRESFANSLQMSVVAPFVPEPVLRRLPDGWEREMAAMYFNVPLDAAFEALLRQPLSMALMQGEADGVKELLQAPGFNETLRDLIESQSSSPGPVEEGQLLNTILAVRELDPTIQANRSLFDLLFSRVSRVKRWSELKYDLTKALTGLIQLNANQAMTPILTALMSSLYSSGKMNVPLIKVWAPVVCGVLDVICSLSNHGGAEFLVESSPSEYVTLMLAISAEGSALAVQMLPSSSDPELIVKELCDVLEKEGWGEGERDLVLALRAAHEDWPWEHLLIGCLTRLNNEELEEDEITETIKTVQLLLPDSENPIKLLTDIGLGADAAWDNFERLDASESEAHILFEMILIAGNASLDSTVTPGPYTYPYRQQTVSAANNQRMALGKRLADLEAEDKLVTTASSFFSAGDWRKVVEADSGRQLAVSLICEAAVRDRPDFFSSEELRENFVFWRKILTHDCFHSVMKLVAVDERLEQSLLENPYDMELDSLYEQVLIQHRSADLDTKVRAALTSEDEDDWVNALSAKRGRLGLMTVLGELDLGVAFEKAISSMVAEEQTEGETLDADALIESLSIPCRDRVFGRLVVDFRGGIEDFWRRLPFAGDLLKTAILTVGPESVVEGFSGMFSSAVEEELDWLQDLLNTWGRAHPKSRAVRNKLRDRLKDELIEATEDKRKTLEAFAQEMGWKL